MASKTKIRGRERAQEALRAVLPRAAEVEAGAAGTLRVAGQPVQVRWIGAGQLNDARSFLAEGCDPERVIVVARELSAGARSELSEAGFGWVDETGAAEIALGTVVVSRTGQPSAVPDRPAKWTASVEAIAEALLCGVSATVSAVQTASGLSAGSCTNGLRFLADNGLLGSETSRGPGSARSVVDQDRLLDAYADAASARQGGASLSVGVAWQDPIAGLIEAGRAWDGAEVGWAATSLAAASVLAPLITNVTSVEVYIDTSTVAGLDAAARAIGLRPMEAGRLILQTPPTVLIHRLAEQRDGLWVAPWPRVFVDLRSTGVRGEDAAEHLREVRHGD